MCEELLSVLLVGGETDSVKKCGGIIDSRPSEKERESEKCARQPNFLPLNEHP